MKEEQETVYLNGFPFQGKVRVNDILGAVFFSIPNLKYWSYDGLKELYVGMVQLLTEFGMKVSARMIHYLPKTREKMLQRIYEIGLSSEKMATLPGFGLSNTFGDKLYGNPERQSIVNLQLRKHLNLLEDK